MRYLILALPLLLAACSSEPSIPQPVDVTTLAPMSSKELALMAAADGTVRNNNPANAEHDYKQAAAASQGHVEAQLALAELYQSHGELAKAEPWLLQAHGFQPNEPRVNYLLGKLAINANEPDRALGFFQQGLEVDPANIDLLNGAGIAYDMQRENTRAQAMYKRAIALHPKSELAMLRTNLAMSYLLSNEPKRAATELRSIAKKPGASQVARHNLALALGLLGKTTEARSLVSQDMTEEERQQVMARLRLYLSEVRHDDPAVKAH
jgi:Flp pilus assembly protein TadD